VILEKRFVASEGLELLPYEMLIAKSNYLRRVLQVPPLSGEMFHTRLFRNPSSTRHFQDPVSHGLVSSRNIRAFQKSVLPCDATASRREMRHLQRGLSSAPAAMSCLQV